MVGLASLRTFIRRSAPSRTPLTRNFFLAPNGTTSRCSSGSNSGKARRWSSPSSSFPVCSRSSFSCCRFWIAGLSVVRGAGPSRCSGLPCRARRGICLGRQEPSRRQPRSHRSGSDRPTGSAGGSVQRGALRTLCRIARRRAPVQATSVPVNPLVAHGRGIFEAQRLLRLSWEHWHGHSCCSKLSRSYHALSLRPARQRPS